jgi:superfamily I DNA/RNA helicase
MSQAELRRCKKPTIVYANGPHGVVESAGRVCRELRARNYHKVGLIAFDNAMLRSLVARLQSICGPFHHVKERGELVAAVPNPGVYLMSPDTCGGLEFDAVVHVGVDMGRVPPPIGGLSPQGYLSLEEEAYIELYTAVTRARYHLVFICDSQRGPSQILKPSISAGLVIESQSDSPNQ